MPCSPLQVRPNEYVRFKKISLEEAFTAIHRTDALVAALTAMARGTLTQEQAQQQLTNFKVDLPAMPPTQPVLVNREATASHPGMLIRLAGDR